MIFIAIRESLGVNFRGKVSHSLLSEYVVQGHRFNIFEDIGCAAALYNTLPLYFLNFMWPLIIGIITATFCGAFS